MLTSDTAATTQALRPTKLVVQTTSEGAALRSPPMFRPPDVPLPNVSFSHADLLSRLQHTPDASPLQSPLRTSPIRLIDTLVAEEKIYLAELKVLQSIAADSACRDALAGLAGPTDALITLSTNLVASLTRGASYFSTPQRDSLLHFSKVVTQPYQAFLSHFKLGALPRLDQAAQVRLAGSLRALPASKSIEADKNVDWLVRRPLSRVKAYASVFKKLLHSSEDATELFIAYEVFQSLLSDARETLQQERIRLAEASQDLTPRAPAVPLNLARQPASRSVSGESTSTQSSTNSHISQTDLLRNLQDAIDVTQARDLFSLARKQCTLELIPRDHEARSLVCRDTFQLTMRHSTTDEVLDCLVEIILLTDLLLIVKPTFARPQLLFPPLLRGVFQVSCVPSEAKDLELDIIGRETIRLTAATAEAKRHWYDLLLACENYELEPLPQAPAGLAAHMGGRAEPGWPAAQTVVNRGRYLPPTPPHTATVPSFGTQPLRVIRENSQLSIAAYSESDARTPDAHDQTPFHFDAETDPPIAEEEDGSVTPRAQTQGQQTFSALLNKPLPKLGGILDLDGPEHMTPLAPAPVPLIATFPQPPTRSLPAPPPPPPQAPSQQGLTPLGAPLGAPITASPLKKSKTINLFGADSVTHQFLNAPKLERTVSEGLSVPVPPASDVAAASPLDQHFDDLDLDFTKDQTFDESLLDLPQLPALSFGEGMHHPSPGALQFSPATLTTFGLPMRTVPVVQPMYLPESAKQAPATPAKTPGQGRARSDSETGGTIAERRLGAGAELTLGPKSFKAAAPALSKPLPVPAASPTKSSQAVAPEALRDAPPARDAMHAVFKTMAECYNWVQGTWRPILMDELDPESKVRAVRSCRVTVLSDIDQCGFLEVYDMKQQLVVNTFSVFGGTSLMRDDSCDISIGFEVGAEKVYLMFRCENPDKANLLQRNIEQARRASPATGFVTPTLPVTPLWPQEFAGSGATALVDRLKIKLYHFQDGKWINKGSARLSITAMAGTTATRVTLTGKTKKGDRVGLVDTVVTGPDEAQSISKTGISLHTGRERYMLQFKGDTERAKMLRCMIPV